MTDLASVVDGYDDRDADFSEPVIPVVIPVAISVTASNDSNSDAVHAPILYKVSVATDRSSAMLKISISIR